MPNSSISESLTPGIPNFKTQIQNQNIQQYFKVRVKTKTLKHTIEALKFKQPASREERKVWGAIIENLALSAETPCSLYAMYLPSGSIMRVALTGCKNTFFSSGADWSCSKFTYKAANKSIKSYQPGIEQTNYNTYNINDQTT